MGGGYKQERAVVEASLPLRGGFRRVYRVCVYDLSWGGWARDGILGILGFYLRAWEVLPVSLEELDIVVIVLVVLAAWKWLN